jgi:multidrug efflux pump
MYRQLPTSFLPNEDQGYLIVNVQLPPGAAQTRTREVIQQVEGYFQAQPEVETVVSVLGFSFSGSGQNAALVFVPLKPWEERAGQAHSASAVAGRAFGFFMGTIRDAFIFPLSPPPIPELGTATGFNFRLQDRAGNGHEALVAARNQLLGMASQSPILQGVRPDGLEDAPQLQLDIDRERAAALGVSYGSVGSVLATALGSSYVNDFPNAGRLQRVIVQAEASARMQPEDVLKLYVPNSKGQQVPLSAFASTRWVTGPIQTVRYNGYPAMKIGGDAAPGYSTGDAMAEMEKLAGQLPPGFGFEWTGQSREEKLSGSQATILLAFSMLAVFLCLAARHAQRRLLQGRPDHHHRLVGEERDPDHRVRQGPDGRGQGPDRGHARSLPSALPPHLDDVVCLHPGRRAPGHCFGRRFGQPARHRHRRDGRHDHRHRARGADGADLLRRHPTPLPCLGP